MCRYQTDEVLTKGQTCEEWCENPLKNVLCNILNKMGRVYIIPLSEALIGLAGKKVFKYWLGDSLKLYTQDIIIQYKKNY